MTKDNVFSDVELKVLEILGDEKMQVAAITEKFFKGKKKVLNPGAVVTSAILRINKKCDFHDLNWFLKGEGLGRGGKTVWAAKR